MSEIAIARLGMWRKIGIFAVRVEGGVVQGYGAGMLCDVN